MPAIGPLTSIPVKQFRKLPRLNKPQGYICVIHDNETGNYHIGQAAHPESLLKRWSKQRPNRYSLIHILMTKNATELKESLHGQFAELSTGKQKDWFKLKRSHLNKLDKLIAQASVPIPASSAQLKRWNLRYFVGSSYTQLPRRQLPRGYVYVLKDLYTENYKIGYTNHPVVRIGYLEMQAAGEVEYVHILQSDYVKETETYLHKRYDSLRTRSYENWEWFQLGDAQLKEIKQLATGPREAKQAREPSRVVYSKHSHAPPRPKQQPSAEPSATQAHEDTQPVATTRARARASNRARRLLGFLVGVGAVLATVMLLYLGSVDI